jgi:hypothetical protein
LAAVESAPHLLGYRATRVWSGGARHSPRFVQFSGFQLKVIQEVITISVFIVFAIFFLKENFAWNYLVAFAFLGVAAFFAFAFKVRGCCGCGASVLAIWALFFPCARGIVPLQDPGIYEFKALSEGKSINRGTLGEA